MTATACNLAKTTIKAVLVYSNIESALLLDHHCFDLSLFQLGQLATESRASKSN